ncbi:MAG: YdcF family protein [Oscillospiraceae bacterium]
MKKNSNWQSRVRIALGVICTVIAIIIAQPMLRGYTHEGYYFVAFFAVGALLLFAPYVLKDRYKGLAEQWVYNLLSLFGVACFVTVITSTLMVAKILEKPNERAETMIVLGCSVYGTELSPMLAKRVEKAAEYANSHPDVTVIVSGGQGEGEDISEAEAMRLRLLGYGVDKQRIILEDRSASTMENLRFSARIISSHKLDNNVIIVTDGFHQYRAAEYANDAGLCSTPLCSHASLWYAASIWFREILAIFRMWMLGY